MSRVIASWVCAADCGSGSKVMWSAEPSIEASRARAVPGAK